ncbi:MAG: HEAT repeat domain-containing protein [Gloeocapsa sp. DLM2.Bin57]|nr:MAG: HEAT repeat domain-containing protein [Gloeocapsa sp. DLM2.Bin57]
MSTILEQAQLVCKQNDWTSANYYLQQLCLDNVSESELTTILDLSLTILAQGDFQQRWDVAKIIPKLGTIAIEPLLTILEDEQQDFEVRWFAGKILANFPEPEVIIAVVNLLVTTEVEELQEIAAMTLASFSKRAIAPLVTLLSYPQYRLLATRALAQIRTREVIEPLLTVVKDTNVNVRVIAIEALGSFGAPTLTPILLDALTDLAAVVRKEAVIALGLRVSVREEEELIRALQPLLQDVSLEVCQQTAIALSKFSDPLAATVLFSTLESPLTPLPLQLTIIQSLAWLETAQSLNYLQQSLSLLEQPAISEIITVLARIQSITLKNQAGVILTEFAQSNSPLLTDTTIKQTLAYSLGQLNLTSTLPILENLAKDRNTGVRLHARNAIDKIQS